MCVTFYHDIGVVVYKSIRIYKKVGEEAYDVMLAIKNNGNLPALEKKIASYLSTLGPDLELFMAEHDFGFRIYRMVKNIDLMDPEGNIIFRGAVADMKIILQVKRLESRGGRAWFELVDYIKKVIVATRVGTPGTWISRVVNGKTIRLQLSANGLGPDFLKTPQYLFNHANNSIKIVLTGSREMDFQVAFKKAGILAEDAADYTWHHLDDFDPETGECTIQLVETAVHKLFPHEGGVSMWKLFFAPIEYQ